MKKRKYGKAMIIAALLILTGSLVCSGQRVSAVFDESSAVTYRQYASSHPVEDSTLFIGTHLIHLSALTDELYEKAQDSASESGQDRVYYKSELSGGAWYDITDAAGLSEITTDGTIVDESELANLWVTYYTGSDGITHDAKSGSSTNPFDDPDPYNLYEMKELEPIRQQYDNLLEISEGISEDKATVYYWEHTRSFFSQNVRNDVTNQCDKQLAALQRCYESLRNEGEEELADIVMKLMSQVDAKRRAEVFSQLAQGDNSMLNNLLQVYSGSKFYPDTTESDEDDSDNEDEDDNEDDSDSDDSEEEQFVPNSNMLTAAGDSLQNCQESYSTNAARMLVEVDGTILQHAESQTANQVIELAEGGAGGQFKEKLLLLGYLYNIDDNVIKEKKEELSVLEDTLLPAADVKYQGQVQAGESTTYRSQMDRGISEAAGEQLLKDQQAETDNACSELQYFITAKTSRMNSEDALAYTYERIDWANGLYANIVEDAYYDKAKESVDAHIVWLTELAQKIIDGDENLKSKLAALLEKKQGLLDAKTEALDNNDLAGAKKYDALIEAVDADIDSEIAKQEGVLSSDDASASDKAQAGSNLNGSLAGSIDKLRQKALSALADGNSAGADSAMGALAAMGAVDALQDIADQNKNNSDASRQINAALKEGQETAATGDSLAGGAGDGSGNGSGNGDGSGNGNGSGNGSSDALNMSRDELLGLLSELLGGEFGDLDADAQLIAAVAMKWLGEKGNHAATDLSISFINQCAKSKNPYVYNRLEGNSSAEYISLKTLGSATGFRYVYSDSRKEATLTKGAKVYRFKVGSAEVSYSDGSKDTMKSGIEFQKEPYVAEDASKQYFDCEAEYFDGNPNAGCMTSNMMTRAENLLDQIMGGTE